MTVKKSDQTPTGHHHGNSGRGNRKWWHVPKHHDHLKMRNKGQGRCHHGMGERKSPLLRKDKHGPLHGYNLARYRKRNGRDVFAIKAAGSTAAPHISFGM